LLESARINNKRVKIIHVSTNEVYSDILVGSYTEEDGLKPSSPYATSKAADLFCLSYYRTYGLNIIITRCTNNFGPYQFPEKLIPKVIIRGKLGMRVPIYGNGRNVRNWIYVLDHCEALELVLEKGKSYEIYNISAGNEIDNLTLVKKILSIMGKNNDLIEFVEGRPGHDIRYSLDSSKIKRELTWRLRYTLDDGLKETINWYLRNEEWLSELVDEKVLHLTTWKLSW
jgi:dTDP-glucose 4,6-dehydratase